jgi:hypothetical protein
MSEMPDHHEHEAIRRLAVNVLLRAVLDLRCRDREKPHLPEQAREWLLNSTDVVWWAAIANIDVQRLRDSVRNGTAQRSTIRGHSYTRRSPLRPTASDRQPHNALRQ